MCSQGIARLTHVVVMVIEGLRSVQGRQRVDLFVALRAWMLAWMLAWTLIVHLGRLQHPGPVDETLSASYKTHAVRCRVEGYHC